MGPHNDGASDLGRGDQRGWGETGDAVSSWRVRRASSTAQRRASSLEGEPSTPTTTLPSVIWWVLMLGSLGAASCHGATPAWPPEGSCASVAGVLMPEDFDESLTPDGQMAGSHRLRSRNGDPDGKDQWGTQRACGPTRLGRSAGASGVPAQAPGSGSSADHGSDRTRDTVQEACARRSLQ